MSPRKRPQPEENATVAEEFLNFDSSEGGVHYYLSSGCTLLDLALSGRVDGGFPGGRICHVYGDESTGKTLLACEVLGSAQRLGGYAFFEDAEGTLDEKRAVELYGLDCGENFALAMPDTIEDLFDNHIVSALEIVRKEKVPLAAMAVDSLSALSAEPEKKETMTKGTYGMSRPKALSKGFRKYNKLLTNSAVTLFIVDQSRVNIDAFGYGKKHTFSGGKAIRFYASVRVFLRLRKKLKSGDRTVGCVFSFEVEKNKIWMPFCTGEFVFLFNYGIDDIASNIRWLRTNTGILPGKDTFHVDFAKVPSAAIAGYTNTLLKKLHKRLLDGFGDLGACREKKFIEHVEQQNLESVLKELVGYVWNLNLTTSQNQERRKPKRREA